MGTEPPIRRAMTGRRRAHAPAPWRERPGHVSRAARWIDAANRLLYSTGPGRALRRRLERQHTLERVEVPLARGGPGLDGLRVAFLSDLHAGNFMDAHDLERLFEQVARESPDLVCLGGDLVNGRGEEALLYRAALRALSPPLGVFAVPGNHEYAAERDLKRFADALSEAGVDVLVNRGRRLERAGDSLWIAGVDDLCLGEPDIALAMHGCRDHEPVLLLSHHPDFFRESSWVGVDLTLSGHTHGGQIVFAGRTPLRHTRHGYWRGLFHDDGAHLYVGRGAGVTLLPLRIGAPPELALLTLRTR